MGRYTTCLCSFSPRAVVLGRVYVFFTLFGYWAHGGGVSQGIGTLHKQVVYQSLGRHPPRT